MKRNYLLPLALPFLLFACKGKEVQCSIKKYKPPCNIAFAGFSGAELDTLVLNTYNAGSGFTQPIKTQTIVNSDFSFSHDSVFISPVKLPFASISAGVDYALNIPATGSRYYLTNVNYSNDTVYMYTRKHDCGTYGTILLPPDSVTINGKATPTTFISAGSTWIVLSR